MKYICLVSLFFFTISISFAQTDTLAPNDTIKKNIKPATSLIHKEKIYFQQKALQKADYDLHTLHTWDELDTMIGFVNNLGLVGKPYRRSIFGFEDRHFQLNQWKNPIYGKYNIDIIDAENGVKYYDTKTPYVNVNFVQGPQRNKAKAITLLDVTASYNITPFWNMTAYIKRRQAESIFGSSTVDTRNIYFSSNYHHRKNRYFLFTHFLYNDANNAFNGGSNITPSLSYSDYFIKGLPTNLPASINKVLAKSYYLDHYYHLIRLKDSAKVQQQLTLRNTICHDFTYQRFTSNNLNYTSFSDNLIPVLPTFQQDSNYVNEKFSTFGYHIFGGASYTFRSKIVNLFLDGGLAYHLLNWRKAEDTLNMSTFEQKVRAKMEIPKLNLAYQFDFQTRPSNLFAPELYMQHHANWNIPFNFNFSSKKDSLSQTKIVVTDSTKKYPLSLNFVYLITSQNPTLFQKYFVGAAGNEYRPLSTLTNQQLNHLHFSIRYQGNSRLYKKDTLLPNFVYLQPYLSNMSHFIYYNSYMKVMQAPDNQTLTWLGAELGGRFCMWKKWYIEGTATYQKGIVSSDADIYLQKYTNHLPFFYTKVGLFHESRTIKYASAIRYGVDVRFNSWFLGHTIDPISTEFYPTDYNVKGYARVDAYFAAKIKRAYIFLKFTNVGDGLVVPGYYSSPFYPGFSRTFSLGINWSFYD
jgi:hypothetical protein